MIVLLYIAIGGLFLVALAKATEKPRPRILPPRK